MTCDLQFLRLGHEGYKKIMVNLMEVAAHLAKGILDTGTHHLRISVALLPQSGLATRHKWVPLRRVAACPVRNFCSLWQRRRGTAWRSACCAYNPICCGPSMLL